MTPRPESCGFADELELDEPEERQSRPKLDRKSQRVWRAGRATLTIVSIASVLTVAALLVLAYLLFADERPMVLVVGLTVLAIALLIYIWRMVWHPRLVSAGTQLIVHNPLRTRVFEWSEVTLVQPGQNGMIIGTDRDQVEAWCVQKGRAAAKRGHRTRADQVADELWTIWDEVDPPMIDEKRGLRIRRARPNETQLLTRMERTTNEHALAHIFPPKRFPYPTADVSRRWQRTLAERQVRVRILEVGDTPAAFIAYDHETVPSRGAAPRHPARSRHHPAHVRRGRRLHLRRSPVAALGPDRESGRAGLLPLTRLGGDRGPSPQRIPAEAGRAQDDQGQQARPTPGSGDPESAE